MASRSASSHAADGGSPMASGRANAAAVARSDARQQRDAGSQRAQRRRPQHSAVRPKDIGTDEYLGTEPDQHRLQGVAWLEQQHADGGSGRAGDVGDQRITWLAAGNDPDAGGECKEQPSRQRDQRQRGGARGLPHRAEQQCHQRLDRNSHRCTEWESHKARPCQAAIHDERAVRAGLAVAPRASAASAAIAR